MPICAGFLVHGDVLGDRGYSDGGPRFRIEVCGVCLIRVGTRFLPVTNGIIFIKGNIALYHSPKPSFGNYTFVGFDALLASYTHRRSIPELE